MRRLSPVSAALLLVVMVFYSCSGSDGAMGPAGTRGSDGTPQPVKILVAASTGIGITIGPAMVAEGVFPIGTEVTSINFSVIAGLDFSGYDAVLIYRGSEMATAQADSLGDKLAAFVDAGGGVVIGQGLYTITGVGGGLGGRIYLDAYSPFKPGTGSGVAGPRTVDAGSLSDPIHPIFNGTDFLNVSLNISAAHSNPSLTPGATLLAIDNVGHNLVAINPNGRVIGTNLFPELEASNGPAMQLLANCLLFVGGGI